MAIYWAFITALLLLAQSARSIGNTNTTLQEAIAGLNRFYSIFDEEPLIKDVQNAQSLLTPKGEIEFVNVKFSINGNQILKGIDFSAKRGKTVALVGLSGSGKSSIINLIPRLFDIDSGQVLFDGQDVRNIKLSDLRSAIALVSQDAVIFENTIAKNICFGAGDKSEAEIINALNQAACDFVFKLKDGIHSQIGPKGSSLSGGERQRLSMARAILRNAPVLLLDEPTSALDSGK